MSDIARRNEALMELAGQANAALESPANPPGSAASDGHRRGGEPVLIEPGRPTGADAHRDQEETRATSDEPGPAPRHDPMTSAATVTP